MFYLTRMCMKQLCRAVPSAMATIRGSREFPEIQGRMSVYDMPDGCVVMTEVFGLPDDRRSMPEGARIPVCSRFFGLHIHEGRNCIGPEPGKEAFLAAGGHFNPWRSEHPFHAGDLPPLLSNSGFAWSAVYTERFVSADILDCTVIIHEMPDDFTSKPAGNAGKRIACGKMMA